MFYYCSIESKFSFFSLMQQHYCEKVGPRRVGGGGWGGEHAIIFRKIGNGKFCLSLFSCPDSLSRDKDLFVISEECSWSPCFFCLETGFFFPPRSWKVSVASQFFLKGTTMRQNNRTRMKSSTTGLWSEAALRKQVITMQNEVTAAGAPPNVKDLCTQFILLSK